VKLTPTSVQNEMPLLICENKMGKKLKKKEEESKERKSKKKPISNRVKRKRLEEFQRRAASKGDEEADVHGAWASYYDKILGEEERRKLQVALAREKQPWFIVTIYKPLGFPQVLQARLEKISEWKTEHTLYATFAILSDKLKESSAGPLKEALQREAKLGRCTLKRHMGLITAIRELDLDEKSNFCLDTSADFESKELCFTGCPASALSLSQSVKLIPLFDHPASTWIVFNDRISDHEVKFDRVLCRVPSSHDGTFRERYSAWKSWRPTSASELAPLQLKIAMNAVDHLKVGGKLCYYTRSLNPVESENVVASLILMAGGALKACLPKDRKKTRCGLIDENGDQNLALMEIKKSLSPFCVRVHPQDENSNGEGYFFIIFERTAKDLMWATIPTDDEIILAHDCLNKLGAHYSKLTVTKGELHDLMSGLSLVNNFEDFHFLQFDKQKYVALADEERVFVTTPQVLNLFETLKFPKLRYGQLLATKQPAKQSWSIESEALWLIAESLSNDVRYCAVYSNEKAENLLRHLLQDPSLSDEFDDEQFLICLNSVTENEEGNGKARLSKAVRKRMKTESSSSKPKTL